VSNLTSFRFRPDSFPEIRSLRGRNIGFMTFLLFLRWRVEPVAQTPAWGASPPYL